MPEINHNDFVRQSVQAEEAMVKALENFVKQQTDQGNVVTVIGDEVISEPGPARKAYDAMYTGFNPAGFAMFRRGYEVADIKLQRLRDELDERIKKCEGQLDNYAHNGGQQMTPAHGELEACKALKEMLT